MTENTEIRTGMTENSEMFDIMTGMVKLMTK